MQLNEAVRKARAELGLSQQKLAERAGLQRRQLATLEQGGNVTLKTLTKILEQLPNLQTFTIQGVTAKVDRAEPPEETNKRYQAAVDTLLSVVRDLAAGRPVGPNQLEALDEAHYIVQGHLGLTPEEVDTFKDLPAEEADQVVDQLFQAQLEKQLAEADELTDDLDLPEDRPEK